jgi:hypothetical protein
MDLEEGKISNGSRRRKNLKFHNAVKEMIRVHLTLVHVFHAYASADTPWVAHALS